MKKIFLCFFVLSLLCCCTPKNGIELGVVQPVETKEAQIAGELKELAELAKERNKSVRTEISGVTYEANPMWGAEKNTIHVWVVSGNGELSHHKYVEVE